MMRRFVAASLFFFVAFVLGLIIDTVVMDIRDIAEDHGVADGVAAPVLVAFDGIVWAIVPALLLGTAAWLVWGVVRRERIEEEQRQVPPPRP